MYDFIFDNEFLSDHGFMICSFSGAEKQWSGGEITFTTGRTPNTDSQKFYTSGYDTPLSCNFSICKKICGSSGYELNREEQSDIMRWLCREDGYHWLQFDTEEYEDVYFHVYFTAQPHFIGSRMVGFDLTMTTDSPYGYSKPMKKQFTLTAANPKIVFKNYSDKIGNIKPKCTIIPKSTGNLILKSGICDCNTTTRVNHVTTGTTLILDENNDYFSGFDAKQFNFKFPVISNSYTDRDTYFEKADDSIDLEMTIEYRFVRKVVV